MIRAIEPFAIMLLWVGAWELVYTKNPTINLIYIIVGYVGEIFLPETFIWGIFFSCGTWAFIEPLGIHPVIAIAVSLPVVVYLEWKQRRESGTVARMRSCVIS